MAIRKLLSKRPLLRGLRGQEEEGLRVEDAVELHFTTPYGPIVVVDKVGDRYNTRGDVTVVEGVSEGRMELRYDGGDWEIYFHVPTRVVYDPEGETITIGR